MKAIMVMAPSVDGGEELMGLALVNSGDEQAATARLEPHLGAPLNWRVVVQDVDVLADLVNYVTDTRKEVLADLAAEGERAAGWDASE